MELTDSFLAPWGFFEEKFDFFQVPCYFTMKAHIFLTYADILDTRKCFCKIFGVFSMQKDRELVVRFHFLALSNLFEKIIELMFSCTPGRTFLGKRHYFSGIAALTPLTPLTYKQNAVNAFIPTKKTALTPLYRQGTPLTLLYQKKLVSTKNWVSHSMKNEKLTVNHLLDKRLRSF